MKIIRINKNGSMNELNLKIPKNCLNVLKKNSVSCGNGNIKELYFWKYDDKNIKCYGWYDGESGFENKHELAPNGTSTFLEEDSSSKLLFGDLFILCIDNEKLSFFYQRSWATITKTKEQIQPHSHDQSNISFAYYPLKPKNSGDIRFIAEPQNEIAKGLFQKEKLDLGLLKLVNKRNEKFLNITLN